MFQPFLSFFGVWHKFKLISTLTGSNRVHVSFELFQWNKKIKVTSLFHEELYCSKRTSVFTEHSPSSLTVIPLSHHPPHSKSHFQSYQNLDLEFRWLPTSSIATVSCFYWLACNKCNMLPWSSWRPMWTWIHHWFGENKLGKCCT